MTSEALAQVPSHVPEDLVFDFDMYNPDGWQDDVHLAWKRVQDTYPPIFWTPRQRGHWVVTRAEDIRHVEENVQAFSSSESFVPRGVMAPQLPVNLDPPEHTAVRRLIMPAFLPKPLREIEVKARRIAIELIEELRPRGECEFVNAFAAAMPIMAFLTMMDLPYEDRFYLRKLGIATTKPDDAESYKAARAELTQYVRGWIDKRREYPGDDLLSAIVRGTIDGRALSTDEIENLSYLVLAGGTDTVVSMMSFAARFLADNPAHRRQLLDNPKLVANAVEEIARRFGTTNMARKVRTDIIYKGIHLAAEDMVMLPRPLAGLDETENPDPLTVDFNRKRIRHTAFGNGPHTCPGAVLARRELTLFMEEWLPRIPDFQVKAGTIPVNSTGLVNSAVELWLQWDPQANAA